MRKRLESLLAEYGTVAIVIYLVIFALTLAGFFIAIRMGWRASSAGGQAGTLAAAWIATKLTQPVRILATLALTPLLVKLYERAVGRRRPEQGTR
jgi:hypothetical protein